MLYERDPRIFASWSMTFSRIFFRESFSRSLSSGSPRARICAARWAALADPLIAIVATGIPGGIMTVERRAS